MGDQAHFDQNDILRVANARAVPARFSAVPRPFLRWAGSKQALIPIFGDLIPQGFGRYYEPFLGAGALFFFLKPTRATLGDMSEELLAVWKAVRDNMAEIERILTPLKPDPDLFYKIRGARSEEPIRRAAEFIYLNKTCWNGLYRVNARGNFNVPYGRPRTDFIFDRDNMHACSKLLARPTISIVKNDFEKTVSRAKPGDFVYFDPPYVTKHNFNGFRDYNERLFSWADQERLSRVALRLKNKGVHVLISNAAHSDILDLYPEFNHRIFSRASTLSSSSAFRGRVDEVVFY